MTHIRAKALLGSYWQQRTLREILGGGEWGGGAQIFNMYAFSVHLRYANLSNIMLGTMYIKFIV